MTYFDTLSPKARVFARGFIDYMLIHTKDPALGTPLRKAQDAGLKALTDEDETISVPYISKLTVMLENQGLIIKVRRGKSFAVVQGAPSVWSSFVELLESGWGSSLDEAIPDEVVQARSEVLDFMNERGAIIITKANLVSKPQYQLLNEKFNAGEYDMAFVKRTHNLSVSDPKTNMRRVSELLAE